MRTHVHTMRLLAVAVTFGLAGCFKLSRESPTLQLYALAGGSAAAVPTATDGASSAARGALTIGLRRLELASYLSVPAVIIRRGANELVV
ncbi:MAG: hypothetical protein ABIW79_04085 [Gemmatimonas sp.]